MNAYRQIRDDETGDSIGLLNDSRQEAVPEVRAIISPTMNISTLLSSSSDTMPTEQITSVAVQSFFAYGDPIFHVMTKEHAQDLISQVYHSSVTPKDNDICELFAIAAAGCCYNNVLVPTLIMSNFIQHCSTRLFQAPGDNKSQRIRCYLGLSLCWDPAKSTVARNLICKS
jgi:hypothetical protein